MLSDSGEVSSKRVAAFLALVNLIVLSYISTFMSKDKITPEFMFDALAWVAGGGLGMTVLEKIFVGKYSAKESPAPVLKEDKSTEDKENPEDLAA